MIVGTTAHGEKPNGPMSYLQKIYYATRSFEAICVVSATLLVAFNYNDVLLLLVLLILGILFAVVSFSANERRERNPWLDYTLYVQRKLRGIEYFKNQAERAVSPSYQQTMLKAYYRGVVEFEEIHAKKHKSEY